MPYTVFTPKRKSFLLAIDNTKWHYAHNYYGVPSYTAKPWHRKIPLSLRTSLPRSTPQNLHVTLVDVLVVLGVFTGLCWLYWGIIKLCQILEEWEEWTQTQEEWEAAQRATCDNPAVGLRAFTPSEMRNNWVWDYINIGEWDDKSLVERMLSFVMFFRNLMHLYFDLHSSPNHDTVCSYEIYDNWLDF